MIRHIVLFRYRESARQDQIERLKDAFFALESKIPGIDAIEHGINDSPEEKNLGFTHVFQLTFEDHAARDAYLLHPEHVKFGELLDELDILADAMVVDYQVL
jgi:hypothetical protein